MASARNIAKGLALQPADRCLNVMPLFHIHGLVGVLLASLAAGSSVVCTRGFSAATFLDWLEEFQPTWYSAVPTMHQVVASLADQYRSRLSRHRFRFIRSSSAALSPATMRKLEAGTGAPVIEAYGMTEASHQMTSNPLPPGMRKPGSVGLPAGAEIAIMDDRGNLLAADQIGEVVIRGLGVMAGYGGGTGTNTSVFTHGWFRTGDLGRLDQEGYLFITGRLKEIVNRGGEKVSPREVDEALLEHDEIAQAAAFGVPHPTLGEDLVAVVVRKAGSRIEVPALREFLFARLAGHKIPSRIIFVDEIPKGQTGKVQRSTLEKRLGHLLAPEFTAATTDVERSLEATFRAILRSGSIGVYDNFFALGGDSLSGMQAVAAINKEHGIELVETALFHHPTVAELAGVVEQAKATERGATADLMREIESMSDEDVERALAEHSNQAGFSGSDAV
jgi:acyl-CoA synthetase (AMP-forming)/AMP-acid ligase II